MTMIEWKLKTKQAREAYEYFIYAKSSYDGNKIRDWLNSGKIETLAVIYSFYDEKEISKKTIPPWTFIDHYNLIVGYFSLCFEKDHEDDYCMHSRYSAGTEIIGWFVDFWDDKRVPRKYLKAMKNWLATLYKQGDKELKECLITATLEYLFEDKEIFEYFSDWKGDLELNEAYRRAKK